MTRNGALQNLRVIDLTDDTGRFATKLLTEAGADVIRLGHGSPGVTMNGDAGKHGGLLDWWYDGGKQQLALDLNSVAGQEQFRALAALFLPLHRNGVSATHRRRVQPSL